MWWRTKQGGGAVFKAGARRVLWCGWGPVDRGLRGVDMAEEKEEQRMVLEEEKEEDGAEEEDANDDGDDGDGDDGEDDDEVDEEEEEEPSRVHRKRKRAEECPYLDTINRNMLDFDVTKQCSVSLNTLNVYCCLVCGKYFQGRSPSSPAALHSLHLSHHVFLNLHNARIYCLPENYEVEDSSLRDIQFALFPKYTDEDVANLDSRGPARTLDGSEYVPGIVGLNNINSTDGMNVVLQLLAHVPHLRNFFIREENYVMHAHDPIVRLFGEFVRKMWSPQLFRKHVSPHELLNEIVVSSKNKFAVTTQCDPVELLQWLLNRLHIGLGGTKALKSSIINRCFRGKVLVSTYRKAAADDTNVPQYDDPQLKGFGAPEQKVVPFLMLSMDVPPPPLFKSESEKNIIPQLPLFALLVKFNGSSVHHNPVTGEKKQYKLRVLPQYLILHVKRFTKNQYFQEKNPTIVNFPIDALDLTEYLPEGVPREMGIYDLCSNIYHDGVAEQGVYKIDIQRRATKQWYEVHDLDVEETMPDFFAISPTSLLVYERRASRVKGA